MLSSGASAVEGASASTDLLSTALTGFGAIGAVAGFLEYIAKANEELADMNTTAKQAGLSLRDFQSVAFGGQVAGLNMDQVNAGLSNAARRSNSVKPEEYISGRDNGS